MLKIDFQESGPDGHIGFPIGTVLAIFDLQVTSYQVSSQSACLFRRSSK